MFEWSDIRYFLAVARTGSTLAASATIAASQSTVKRRIDALEEALDLKLFERRAQGYVLTDQGEALLPLAEKTEAAMTGFAEAASAAKRHLSGHIKFTLPGDATEPAMLEPIKAFKERHPGVKVELLIRNEFLDIGAGEADVGTRAGPRPTDEKLAIRKIGDIYWQGYCSPDYIARNGVPTAYEPGEHSFIGAEGHIAFAAPLRRYEELTGEPVVRASTIKGMISFAEMGMGIALVPPANITPAMNLVPCLPPLMDSPSELWVVTRDELRKTPHIRAFVDFIVAHASVMMEKDKQDRIAFWAERGIAA